MPSDGKSLTREDVVTIYKVLLNRFPESDSVVDWQFNNHSSVAHLVSDIVKSDEFLSMGVDQKLGKAIESYFFSPPQRVDTEVDSYSMHKMLSRTREQWAQLGEIDPHYSVISIPQYRADRIDQSSLQNFRRSGAEDLSFLERFESLTGVNAGSGVCLEFGCGVGRVTRYLASRFRKIIAVDISPGNLELCEKYMASDGVTNVETIQLADVSDLSKLPEFDTLFSRIVFQHNPPPVQKLIITELLKKTRRAAFFQAATDIPGYSFDVKSYFDGNIPEMEMHCLPRHTILKIIRESGMHLLDMSPDNAIGPTLGSFTFYASR